MKVALVSNGARIPPSRAERIERLVANGSPGATAARTTHGDQATALVRAAIANGAQRIVVAGGDGTVHEAANALAGTGVELAVIPQGSGNDYARSLGVPFEIEAAAAFALRAAALPTDAGEIVCASANGGEARRIFLNIAEAGFGAEVVRYARTTVRFAPAWVAYQLAILAALATLRTNPVRLSAEGREAALLGSTNLIVGLGQYFGAGLHPLPDALLDDGLFEIAHIRDASRLDIARHAPMLKRGIPPGHPKVERMQCRTLRVESDASVPVEADGEVIGCLPATFTVLPGALRVVRKPSGS